MGKFPATFPESHWQKLGVGCIESSPASASGWRVILEIMVFGKASQMRNLKQMELTEYDCAVACISFRSAPWFPFKLEFVQPRSCSLISKTAVLSYQTHDYLPAQGISCVAYDFASQRACSFSASWRACRSVPRIHSTTYGDGRD